MQATETRSQVPSAAGRSGSVCRAAGQPGRARAHARGGRAPNKRGGARSGLQPGRLPHPEPSSLADRRSRSLCLRVTDGPRPDRTQARVLGEAGTDAPLSCLIADRARDRDAFRAGRVPQGIEAVLPARSWRPQPRDPARYPARHAGARGLGGLGGASRGRPLRPIRATAPGFSVPGGGWDRAEIPPQHYLDRLRGPAPADDRLSCPCLRAATGGIETDIHYSGSFPAASISRSTYARKSATSVK